MGKQLTIYLNEQEIKRLAEIAAKECRSSQDRARYILLSTLGLVDNQNQENPTNSKSVTSKVSEAEQVNAFAGINP